MKPTINAGFPTRDEQIKAMKQVEVPSLAQIGFHAATVSHVDIAPSARSSLTSPWPAPTAPGVRMPSSHVQCPPVVRVFVKQQGSWWWTSNSDGMGSNPQAADAQRRIAEPLPTGFHSWTVSNEFHFSRSAACSWSATQQYLQRRALVQKFSAR